MRSLLVMGIPYQHAPEVSIVRTDTCLPTVSAWLQWLIIAGRRLPSGFIAPIHPPTASKPLWATPVRLNLAVGNIHEQKH
jgi:hypothetical protein